MKYILIALSLAVVTPAFADIGISLNIGAPDFFGRIDIEGAPPPVLLSSRPIVIERPSVDVEVEPLYLHVPETESRDWRHYCNRYNACGRPVYFVKDRWYRQVYAPHYRSHHEEYEHRREQWHEHYDRRDEREWREHRDHEEHRNDMHHERYDERHDERHEDHRDQHHDDMHHDQHDDHQDEHHDEHHDHDDHHEHHDDGHH